MWLARGSSTFRRAVYRFATLAICLPLKGALREPKFRAVAVIVQTDHGAHAYLGTHWPLIP